MRPGALLLGCALVITLAGCGSDGGGWVKVKGGTAAAAGSSAEPANAGPPPGGWPQPENGRLTVKMCGLLTDADYTKFGHHRLPKVSEELSKIGANAVGCRYMTDDELTLDLHPTAESAKLVFAAALRGHRQRLAEDQRQSILATSVVPGADESWFDYATFGSDSAEFKETELHLRRGSLLVSITLNGVRGKTEPEPRTVLTGLAALVLQRIPNVGKTDTGRTHKVRYDVLGAGRALSISYSDPTSGKAITRKNVPLPWHIVLPMGETEQPVNMLSLSAASGALNASLGCRILVDGKALDVQPRNSSLVFCQGNYQPTGS